MNEKNKVVKNSDGGITRRTFNKYALATGVSVGMGGLFSGGILAGCSNSGSNNETSRATKSKDLHFDLSHVPQNEDFFIKVMREEYELLKHTDLTRSEHRSKHAALINVPDDKLTHYITDLPLPVDALVIIPIKHTATIHSGSSHGLAGAFIHNPERKVSQNLVPARISAADAAGDSFDADHVDTPLEAAKAIIFHHPELMKLDPTLASSVWEHIENTTEVNNLADSISFQGPAYTTPPDGWAILTPAKDADDNEVVDANGNTLYHYSLSEQTKLDAAPALKKVLQSVKDDVSLQDTAWGVHDGIDSVDQSTDASAVDTAWKSLTAADTSVQVDIRNKQPKYGISTWITNFDPVKREITLVTKNNYLRHLSFYVQYLDAQRNPIDPGGDITFADLFLNFYDDKKYFVAMLPPELTVFGVPVYGPETTNTITMPDEASYIKLLYGSLGHCNYAEEAFVGLLATTIIDLAIPSIMLVMAVGNLNKETTEEEKDKTVKDIIISILKTLNNLNQIKSDIHEALNGGDVPAALIKLSKTVYGMLSGPAAEHLALLVAEQIGSEALEEAIPFVGWALEVASIVATISDLAQTTVEVCNSPCVYSNEISATQDICVTINHDPDDPQGFPATATHYKVVLQLNDKTTGFVIQNPMPLGVTADPIVETFTGVPSGGKVKALVSFYSDTGWMAGHGATTDVDNLVPANASLLDLGITIKEAQVPLTQDTTYSHKNRLEYTGSQYVWTETGAPSATAADLDSGNIGDNLGALNGITFHEPTASIGYAWRAAGSNIQDCATGASSKQLHMIRGISSEHDPEESLQTLSCGFNNPSAIIYDLMNKSNLGYYIDSRTSKKYIRGIDLTGPGAIDPDNGLSYGHFTQELDAVVIHNGIAVGANWLNSKLETKSLPDAAVADNQAQPATPISGKGSREGLVHGPVALAVSATGSLLVLETENTRVQAMDFHGNPQKIFDNKSSYFMNLRTQSSPVRYLDLGVEYTGYTYVLYHRNNGSNQDDYSVDIYTPQGDYLSSTSGVAAAKLVIDYWRNMYTLNYERISGLVGAEPSVSQWIPSTP